MKRKILFVDDESKVLDGLRRSLRKMNKEWEMIFVESGEAALLVLKSESFDVIVSDMRMPGMDGVELLTKVMRIQPSAVRIILSGHSEQELILRSVHPAHQFLSKPCDIEKLKETISHSIGLREILADPRLQKIVSQIGSLPTLPNIYFELVGELDKEDTSPKKIGEIVAKDIGLVGNILKVVNSSFFGFPREISSPEQAVTLLGLDTIKALTLSTYLFNIVEDISKLGFSLDALWRHSLFTSTLAKKIAEFENMGKIVAEQSFMGGLIHDVGKLIMAYRLPSEYRRCLDEVKKSNKLVWEVEREMFGPTHAEVGAYLMGLWGIPDSILHALAFHHNPSALPSQEPGPLTFVHAANHIEHELIIYNEEYARPELDMLHLESVGILSGLPQWINLGRTMIEKQKD